MATYSNETKPDYTWTVVDAGAENETKTYELHSERANAKLKLKVGVLRKGDVFAGEKLKADRFTVMISDAQQDLLNEIFQCTKKSNHNMKSMDESKNILPVFTRQTGPGAMTLTSESIYRIVHEIVEAKQNGTSLDSTGEFSDFARELERDLARIGQSPAVEKRPSRGDFNFSK